MKTNILCIIIGLVFGCFIGNVLTVKNMPALGGIAGGTGLTDQQLYILTEILQDKVPAVDPNYTDTQQFTSDYVAVAQILNDNLSTAATTCENNNPDNDCSLYDRIQTRVADIQNSVDGAVQDSMQRSGMIKQ